MVTWEAGMVKVYLLSAVRVISTAVPSFRVTVRVSSSYPSSGLTVMVTLVPLEAREGLTDRLPFSTSEGRGTA